MKEIVPNIFEWFKKYKESGLQLNITAFERPDLNYVYEVHIYFSIVDRKLYKKNCNKKLYKIAMEIKKENVTFEFLTKVISSLMKKNLSKDTL